MPLKCPHCYSALEISSEVATSGRTVVCASCGSSIELAACNTASWRPSADRRMVGRFELLDILGEGAFGSVYLARDTQLDRQVAIKVPRRESLATPADLERFLREARSTAQLRHPGIVAVHDAGQADGVCYLVSELVRGATLAERLTGERLTARASAGLLEGIARAVHYAHEQGVIHRDLKPANIMLDLEGKPHVMDFGLARRESAEITVTLEGQILGTPAYMSPEQAQGLGHRVDARSDVYSLGVILYELLTGELPFRGNKRMLIVQVIQDEPQPPRRLNEKIPRDLETICLKAMAKSPARRYATAGEMADDLARWRAGEPIRARPLPRWRRAARWIRRRPAAAGLIGMGLAGLAILSVYSVLLHDAYRRVEDQTRAAHRSLYAARMQNAHRAWDDAQLHRVLETLNSTRPEQTGGDDLRGWEWWHLARACASDRRTWSHAAGTIRAVAFSPAGTRLASAGDDGRIRMWNVDEQGQPPLRLAGHGGVVTSLAFHPNGEQLASASVDSTVRIWSVHLPGEPSILDGHVMAVNCVAYAPDGTRLATASDDCTVKLWDVTSDREVATLLGHQAGVRCLAFDPQGLILASGGDDRAVRLWDVAAQLESGRLVGHRDKVLAVSFHPELPQLASVSEDKTLRVWNLDTKQEIASLPAPAGSFRSVAFSPDGRYLVAAGMDRLIHVWDARTLTPQGEIKGHVQDIWDMEFALENGQLLLATGGSDGTVRLWDLDSALAADVRIWQAHELRVTDVAFSPDGTRLASASYDQRLRIWNADTGAELLTLGKHEIHRTLAADGSPGPLQRIETYSGHEKLATAVAFSPTDARLASAGFDHVVRIWDVDSGQETLALRHGGEVSCVAFSPDGKTLASGGWDDRVYLWNLVAPGRPQLLLGHTGNISSVAFHTDGRRLVSGSWDGSVRVWDVATSASLVQIAAHAATVNCVAVHPGDNRLASASDDLSVRIWDGETGRLLKSLEGHTDRVVRVAFSPDGSRLLSASQGARDSSIRLWDTASGQEVARLSAHDSGFHAAVFSPDGRRIATSGGREIAVWESEGDREPPSPISQVQRAPETAPPLAPRLKVLGRFLARELPNAERSDEPIPAGDEHEFVVLVASAPAAYLALSAQEYELMAKTARDSDESAPLAPRESMQVLRPDRFFLVPAMGTRTAAVLVSQWPLPPTGSGGFYGGSVQRTSSDRIPPWQRLLVALAFRCPAGDDLSGARLQHADEPPVELPLLTLPGIPERSP